MDDDLKRGLVDMLHAMIEVTLEGPTVEALDLLIDGSRGIAKETAPSVRVGALRDFLIAYREVRRKAEAVVLASVRETT